MENFDIAQNVLTSSLESAGSAMQEYNTYLEGIEAKTNQFKAAFEALSTTVVNSDFLKGIIEFGTKAISVLDNIIQSLGGIGSALLIISGIIASLNLSGTISLLGKIGVTIKNIASGIFNSSFVKGLQAIPAGLTAITTKSKAAASAFHMLGGATSVATVGLTALVAVIGIAIAIYQNYKQKIEEARQAAEDAANSHNELAASMDEYKTKIISLREELDKGNLSEEEAYNKRKELISIQDELISRFGKEAEGISLVTGEIKQSD